MKNHIHIHTSRTLRLAAVAALLSSSTALGQTWTGDISGNWTDTGNWSSAPAFDTSTDLTFYQAGAGNLDNFLGGAKTARSIIFNADADANVGINLNDGDSAASDLTLQAASGSAGITVASGASGNFTIGNAGVGSAFGNLALASDLLVNHAGTGTLLINQPVSGSTVGITKSGAGTLNLSADNSPFTGNLTLSQGTLLSTGNSTTTTQNSIGSPTLITYDGGTLHMLSSQARSLPGNMTVTAATGSTLIWENPTDTGRNLSIGGAGSVLSLDGNLRIQNLSANASLQNVVNITRVITGAGTLTYEGSSPINSIDDNYSGAGLGRIQMGGNNTGWSGGFVLAKGAGIFSGMSATISPFGTGSITLGVTADSAGAGLSFSSGAAAASINEIPNDIIVRTGGFRSLRGTGNQTYSFGGNVTLEGILNMDMAMTNGGRYMRLTGNISGNGGLDITRSGSGDYVALTGNNTFTGNITVNTSSELRVNTSSTGSGNGVPDTAAITLTATGSELRIQTDETIGSLASTGVFGNLVLSQWRRDRASHTDHRIQQRQHFIQWQQHRQRHPYQDR
jgi:fibronectin-binding autotransporter adhesin